MAEKSIDKVAEEIERLDVRRNTSNQIISYTLPDNEDNAMRYGMFRITGERKAYTTSDFNRVLDNDVIDLLNPIPQLELSENIKATLVLSAFTAPEDPLPEDPFANDAPVFDDIFSARYELPPNKTNTYRYAQSYEPTVYADIPYGYTNLGFSKVVSGPPQTTPGRYTITKELIDSGYDLQLTYRIGSFDKRDSLTPSTLSNRQAKDYLNRYPDIRWWYSERLGTPMWQRDNYTSAQIATAKTHWVGHGRNEKRYNQYPLGVSTQFRRIRKLTTDTSIGKAGDQETLTDWEIPRDKWRVNGKVATRPQESYGFNHIQTITINNSDMLVGDEWEIAGMCGTQDNDEVGYYVDSSYWDIEIVDGNQSTPADPPMPARSPDRGPTPAELAAIAARIEAARIQKIEDERLQALEVIRLQAEADAAAAAEAIRLQLLADAAAITESNRITALLANPPTATLTKVNSPYGWQHTNGLQELRSWAVNNTIPSTIIEDEIVRLVEIRRIVELLRRVPMTIKLQLNSTYIPNRNTANTNLQIWRVNNNIPQADITAWKIANNYPL